MYILTSILLSLDILLLGIMLFSYLEGVSLKQMLCEYFVENDDFDRGTRIFLFLIVSFMLSILNFMFIDVVIRK